MGNWTLRTAKTYVIKELQAAEQSELQALRHLRNAGEGWIKIKEELGDRGLNIADWCKEHMPVSRQWLDRHAELAKGWRKFLSARKWANDVGYMSRRESGLDYALELMAAKQRSGTVSSASTLAHDPDYETVFACRDGFVAGPDPHWRCLGDATNSAECHCRRLCDVATVFWLSPQLPMRGANRE